ncbi:hypothetical protein KIW84_033146 [Lathyrus oleraceus]|uniref:DUF7745 domain-containing protein n=1 Tax=Pisum sativum TaxID=3888 RepID=A0A9D4XV65_PEA|nr:hypothetical protein KIW84_033146 [Pisum sativum]
MGSERRNNLPLKFKLPRVNTLIALHSKITLCNKNNFICRYGQILDLLTTLIDVSALVALSQYYDPSLVCFTFKDFQLAPTIEEYENLLGWYVKDHPPFTKLGKPLMPESVTEALHLPIEEVSLGLEPMGFARKFLEDKAWALEKEGKWLPFSAILALLIYGVNVIHRQEENRQANPGANVNANATNPIMGNGVLIVTQAHAKGMSTNLNAAHTYHVHVHGGSQAGTEDHEGEFFMPRNESMYKPFRPP